MDATALLLSVCLLGQATPPAVGESAGPLVPVQRWAHPDQKGNAGAKPAAHEEPAAQPSEGETKESAELRASDLIVGLMMVPETAKLEGRRVSLFEVLGSSTDRAGQLAATHAYWKLCAALAEHNQTLDEQQQFERLVPAKDANAAPAAETASIQLLESRLAGANARLRETEVALAAARYELAERLQQAADQPLPLPDDPPHVGTYSAKLSDVYGAQQPPSQAVLFSRTSPLRHQTIELRAAAVQAALDASDAIEEQYHRGETDLSTLLAAIEHASRQRRAFVASVRDYNADIAEYALNIPVLPSLTLKAQVALLVRPRATDDTMTAGGARTESGVERAGFNEPIPSRPSDGTQKKPAGAASPPADGGPAPPFEPERDGQPRESQRPPATPGDVEASSETTDKTTTIDSDVNAHRLYVPLVDTTSERRARQLAEALHWDHEIEPTEATRVSLRECLVSSPAERRQALLDAYWLTSQRAARYHVAHHRSEQLHALTPIFVSRRDEPGAAEAMLSLRAAQATGEAEALDARRDLVEAEFALTQLTGRSVTAPWLLPGTAPHAGDYRLKLSAQPAELRESAVVRRLADSIPALRAALLDRASAVVSADTARATATAELVGGKGALAETLAAIDEQAAATGSFLATLTDYNRAIGAYALAVVPAETPLDVLCKALVVASPT